MRDAAHLFDVIFLYVWAYLQGALHRSLHKREESTTLSTQLLRVSVQNLYI